MTTTRLRTQFKNYTRTNQSFEEVFGGCYECDLIATPRTVLDIGANEGAFTAWALEKWPDCKITAFEPVPDNTAIFRENHSTNQNVTLHQCAVSIKSALDIHLGKNNSGDCSTYDIGDQLVGTIPVHGAPPSGIESHEFVKVDTEGCELEIISGLDLSKTVALVCEWHRDEDCRKIIEVVERAGLKLFHCKPWFKDRGEMGFARPGSRREIQPETKIPDDMNLSGKTPDGKTISLTAGNLRHEHLDPRLKHVKLFVGLPIYGQPTMAFVRCLMGLQAQKPCAMEVHVGQGDGVGRTRNVLTAQFLKSDCTHLLFMDSDLIFTIQHIKELLLANQPVVGGFYPKKQQGKLEWVANALQPSPPMRDDGLQPVKYVGTGFLCIKREVFEKMALAYPEIGFREDYGNRGIAHDFWSMGVHRNDIDQLSQLRDRIYRIVKNSDKFDKKLKDEIFGTLSLLDEDFHKVIDCSKEYSGPTADQGRYLTEDWFFCQRWLDMGGENFAHTRVALRHLGPVIFPLDTQMSEVANPLPV